MAGAEFENVTQVPRSQLGLDESRSFFSRTLCTLQFGFCDLVFGGLLCGLLVNPAWEHWAYRAAVTVLGTLVVFLTLGIMYVWFDHPLLNSLYLSLERRIILFLKCVRGLLMILLAAWGLMILLSLIFWR